VENIEMRIPHFVTDVDYTGLIQINTLDLYK